MSEVETAAEAYRAAKKAWQGLANEYKAIEAKRDELDAQLEALSAKLQEAETTQLSKKFDLLRVAGEEGDRPEATP